MKQKEVFKKIGGIIQELNDQYEYLKTVEGNLNDLELELFVANAHFLTDHIEILCKLNLQNIAVKQPAAKQETNREQKYFEPVVQQMKHGNSEPEEKPAKQTEKPAEPTAEKDNRQDDKPVPHIDLSDAAPVDTYSVVMEEPETIRHELVLDEAENWDEEEETIENDRLKTAKKTKVNTPEPKEQLNGSAEAKEVKHDAEKKEDAAAKTTDDEVLTINQKMSTQLGEKAMSKTEQLSIKPISDIKLAITLNDKLLYVKDLFNGYNLAYSEAIEILNRFNTFEEAMRFLKTNYVTKNNWDSKPATTEKFYALLKRRYA